MEFVFVNNRSHYLVSSQTRIKSIQSTLTLEVVLLNTLEQISLIVAPLSRKPLIHLVAHFDFSSFKDFNATNYYPIYVDLQVSGVSVLLLKLLSLQTINMYNPLFLNSINASF